MKKIWFLVVLFITSFSITAQQYGLQEIVNGVFSSKVVKPVVSSADGMHYYQMNDKSNAVIKFEYATGNVVDTLFSTQKARQSTFDSFQGFLVSPDEFRVIVYTDKEQIYRRSFKAN